MSLELFSHFQATPGLPPRRGQTTRTRDQPWRVRRKLMDKLKETDHAMKSAAHHNQVSAPPWHTLDHETPSVFAFQNLRFFSIAQRRQCSHRCGFGAPCRDTAFLIAGNLDAGHLSSLRRGHRPFSFQRKKTQRGDSARLCSGSMAIRARSGGSLDFACGCEALQQTAHPLTPSRTSSGRHIWSAAQPGWSYLRLLNRERFP